MISIQCLPPCSDRKVNLNKTYQAYCVKLENVEGVEQVSSSSSYYLQATLFDQKFKKFVGSSWIGNSVSVKNKSIIFNQSFYFYTAIPGKELFLVAELITESKVPKSQKLIGWICMSLIDPEESSSNLEHSVSYKISLLHGTPLALLILKDESRGAKLSDHMTEMELSLSLMPYPLLLQTVHLVPENVLFDASKTIPGLISDTADVIHSSGYIYKPHLQKSITFVLENVCIRIHPSIEEAEKIILLKVMREYEAVGSTAESKAKIVQRRLQVGIHNGYCFIQECDFYHLLVEPIVTPKAKKTHHRSSSMGSINFSRENGLTLRSDVKIPNVPDDSNIMFVFLLEYTISLSNTKSDQPNIPSSISKSPTSNIAIAWGFVKLSNLKTNPSYTVTLTSDSTLSPYKILFLRTESSIELSFTTASVMKQNKNLSSGLSVGDFNSVASFSTKTYVSPETSYVHSPAISMYAPKHKSVGDIPTTLMQNEVCSSKNDNSKHFHHEPDNNMNLQEVTLVPSSLPLMPPLLHSFPLGSDSSFKMFTKLYWDKLQPVLDHHGKPATVVDGNHPYNIKRDLELCSPPQKNECMLQLLAISCLGEYSQVPSEMFFTFQFYRFLPVRTESLTLKPLSENEESFHPKSSMVYALLKFRNRERSPGFQVTYNIDPSELGAGEYKSFLNYLMKQTLHIDIWNGQSLLYFGTVLLPLKYFCRQGKDATSVSLELEIINCEFPDETLSQTTLFSKTCKGKLHVRLASIRHPLPAASLEKLEEDCLNSESCIIFPKTEKNKSGVYNPVVSKARPIVETNRELTNLLASRCVVNCSQKSQDSFLSEERKRKLARMEAVRNLENENKSTTVVDDSMYHFLKERERDLLTIESYIQKNKSEMIQSLLHTSVTYEKQIYPVIGSKAYFEFVLENPFPESKEVEISWKSPELSLVKDLKLWQKLRSMNNIPKQVEQIAFSDINSDVSSVLLQPKEKIHIPFTYCSLAAQSSQLEIFKTASGHHFTSDILTSAPVTRSLMTSTIKIRFMTVDQTLLAILILKVQPLPPSFTHVFKFLSMEHSMFKKVIRINSESLKNHKISVRCSDSDAVCSIQEQCEWEDDSISIQIKAPTKAAGKLKEFYLFLYKDAHQVIAFQTWIVTICPLQRIDLSCISGQLMRSSLLIRGTHATNLVKCYSSSSDLQLHPSDSFLLSPFAVQELSMNVRSLLPGIKHFQITMVNQALELVLQSWLLVLSCQKPSVSKAFQVHLNVGKEATKRITYTNPYNQDRTFVLHSSHPHLLRLRENTFCVPMGKSYCIGLYFLPQDHVFTETFFLYLNDMADKNEETYCIKVICQ